MGRRREERGRVGFGVLIGGLTDAQSAIQSMGELLLSSDKRALLVRGAQADAH